MSVVETSEQGPVFVLSIDDGKANAFSPSLTDEVRAALDVAESASAGSVLMCGRAGVFSGGFDLRVIGKSRRETAAASSGSR